MSLDRFSQKCHRTRRRLELRGIAVSKSAGGFDVELPRSLKAERRDDIAILFLARAESDKPKSIKIS